jgi:hypothetical protein
MPRPPSLTPDVEARILGYIRAGGFAHVAAEAAGVPRETFADWLDRGSRTGAREPYRSFARQVREALAQARLRAEIAVMDKTPLHWLRYGPGRETAEAAGWTGTVRPASATPERKESVLTSPDWAEVWELLRAALEGYPELRAALAERLGGLGNPEKV